MKSFSSRYCTFLGMCATTLLMSLNPTLAQETPAHKHIAPPEVPVQFKNDVSAQLIEATSLIRAAQARNTYNVDGSGLTVAVLDTGLRTTHQDFAGRIAAQRNFTPDNGSDPNNVADGHGHGTNVGGIIVANSVHIGIAPGARIIPMKVLTNAGGGSYDYVNNALQWVLDNRSAYNISVVNMSLSSETNDTSFTQVNTTRTLIENLRAAGVAVVISAGNAFHSFSSAEGMGYPAIIQSSVSVGAVYDDTMGSFTYGGGGIAYSTAPDRVTPFSQRLSDSVGGEYRTDIFAPGAALTASGIASDTGSSTMHGTSQAAPVTAGVILLMQQHYKKLTGKLPTVDMIEAALRSSAVTVNDGDDEDDNVTNTGKNFPRVDAVNALQAITPVNTAPTAQPLRFDTLQNQPVTIDLKGSDADGDTLTYTITNPPTTGTLSKVSATRYIYTPKPYHSGTVGLFYKVNDGQIDSPRAAVKISIRPNSALLIANWQKVSVARNQQVVLTLTSSGGASGITYHLVAPPRRGKLQKISNTQYLFTAPNEASSISFSFNVTDGTQTSNTAYVSVSVQ